MLLIKRLAAILLLAFPLASHGQQFSQKETVKTNVLHVLHSPTPVRWWVMQPLGLDKREFRLIDNSSVIVFYTGNQPGKVFYIDALSNGEEIPDGIRYEIVVEGDPAPPDPDPIPPDPVVPPDLDGIALAVWKNANAVNLPRNIRGRASAAYYAVAAQIELGDLKDTMSISKKLKQLMPIVPESSRPLWDCLQDYIEKNGVDAETTSKMFYEIAKGFEA